MGKIEKTGTITDIDKQDIRHKDIKALEKAKEWEAKYDHLCETIQIPNGYKRVRIKKED